MDLTTPVAAPPVHVSIIMDGNRRWAKNQGLLVLEGHQAGAAKAIEIIEASLELGIKVLSLFVFSTENWARDQLEVEQIMFLASTVLLANREKLRCLGARIHVIGDLEKLNQPVREALRLAREATCSGSNIDVILAVNYGGRDELRRAFIQLAHQVAKGKICIEEIEEEHIAQLLDTHQWPDPDLLIRTSGERRLSNFLIWQHAYTECYFCHKLWPEFSKRDLVKALAVFNKRKRRYGS